MWKLLQNIPRVFKKSNGVRSITKFHENESDRKHSVQNHVCRLSHTRAILPQILSTSHKFEQGYGGSHKDRQKQEFEKFWSLNKHCTAEAFGLGAVIIIFVQLGKLWPKRRLSDEDEIGPSRYCVFKWLHNIWCDLQLKPSIACQRLNIKADESLKFENLIKKYEELVEQHQEESQSSEQAARQEDEFIAPSLGYMQYESSLQSLQKLAENQVELGDYDTDSKSTCEPLIQAEFFEGSIDVAGEKWISMAEKINANFQNEAGIFLAKSGRVKEAMSIWKSSSCASCNKSLFNIGVCYETGQGVSRNLREACKYYSIASAMGHLKAKYNLAMIYLSGQQVTEKSFSEALSLLKFAANHGLDVAQVHLGVLYTEDDPKDFVKAVEYFTLAAEQKDKDGLFYLGVCYENGFGVERNTCKAADLYFAAAKAGHSTAQYNLAVFFEKGLGGLPEDLHTAADMFEKAALLGESGAELRCKQLRKEIRQLEIERMRLELSGVNIVRSNSTPSFPPSPLPITKYLQEHMADFAVADAKMDDIFTDVLSDQEKYSDVASISSTDSFEISFQLGDDNVTDTESFSDINLYDIDCYSQCSLGVLSTSKSAPMLELSY